VASVSEDLANVLSAVQDINVGTGSGARVVTITVNDGSTVLENVKVRMTEGANSFVGTTNSSGITTFNLDDATYTVSITKSGYSFSGTSLVVNGTEAETYSMTAITFSAPPTASQTTGYMTTLGADTNAKGNVRVYFMMTSEPDDTGLGYDPTWFSVASNSAGLLEVTLAKGASYKMKRSSETVSFTVPSGAGSSYELPTVL